jgi:hypothetical protein
MSLRRSLPGAVGLALAAGALITVASPATPAFAICDGPTYTYSFTGKTRTALPGNVYTPWAEGPATVTLSGSKTTTVNATLTASVSAEAGIVFAKASTSLGISVGKTWSNTSSWSVAKKVPSGKEGRLRVYHDAVKFKVTKKHLVSPCDYQTVYSSWVTAPEKGGDTVVKLNLRAAGSAAEDSADIEVQDVATRADDEGVLSNE